MEKCKKCDSSISTWLKPIFRLEKYAKINHLCTDENPVYGYYKFTEKHRTTKAETSLVKP